MDCYCYYESVIVVESGYEGLLVEYVLCYLISMQS